MRRSIRPCLEALEGKALLSSIPASGLADSLTAVASRTLSGAQVVLTFTKTNVSSHDITVDHGPTNEGFTITQGGKSIWNQNAGQLLPQFLEVDDLKPHQSITLTETWDGRANDVNPDQPWVEGSPLSGTFTASNALDQGATKASVTIPKSWTVPVKPTHITPPKPPIVHIMSTAVPVAKKG
jgi:Intracellular proteinase inhibitor